jgi:hypothetical protein
MVKQVKNIGFALFDQLCIKTSEEVTAEVTK